MAPIVTIFASLFAGPLVEWAGPQRVLTVSMALSTVLWLLMAFPTYKAVLFAAKAGLSACSGVVATLQMPFLAELTPAKMRGTIGAMADVWGGTGLIFGYLMAHLFSWRLATALCSLTGGLLVIPMLLVPEVGKSVEFRLPCNTNRTPRLRQESYPLTTSFTHS